jgi:hypothetical protein
MKRILFGIGAVGLAALTTGCGAYYERSYAVAAPGAVYYGDRYYPSGYRYYYPSTAYVYSYRDTGSYYRTYNGIHAPAELSTM